MSELDLIKGCLADDQGCHKKIFHRYGGKMFAICLRYMGSRVDAEDVLQEAFVRIFQNLNRFRGEGSLEGWMRRIVINTALQALRSKGIHPVEAELEQAAQASVPAAALAHLAEHDLLNLVAALPPGYRLVFNLYAIEGYTHGEIAQLLQIKESSSRSQLAKARQLLQKQLAHLHRMAV